MDARGLVAFIVTLHEAAAVLGLLVGALIALLGALLLRNMPRGRRLATIAAFALGGAMLTFAITARMFKVSALDVEIVRVSE